MFAARLRHPGRRAARLGRRWIWALIVGGLVAFALFVLWQARTTKEPLVPLQLFRDRNFSVSNVGISAMGFAATAMGFPLMLYAQLVRGLSPPSRPRCCWCRWR